MQTNTIRHRTVVSTNVIGRKVIAEVTLAAHDVACQISILLSNQPASTNFVGISQGQNGFSAN